MLLALLSGQRSQTLQSLSIRNMDLNHNRCVFKIDKLLKTSKPGKHLAAVEFNTYTLNSSLCSINCLTEYIQRRKELRNENDQLPVSTRTLLLEG